MAHNLLRVARVIYLIPRANSLVTLSSSNALSLTWPPTARLTMVPPTLLTFDSNSRRASRYPWGRSIWGPMRQLVASAIHSADILKGMAAWVPSSERLRQLAVRDANPGGYPPWREGLAARK